MRAVIAIALSALLASASSPCSAAGERRYSDELAIRNIGVADGLSQNTARCLGVDRQGFIWVGTDDGLNRYDGLKFNNFKQLNDALANNPIESIDIDTGGFIWARLGNGRVVCLNTHTIEEVQLTDDLGREALVTHTHLKLLGDSLVLAYGDYNNAYAFDIRSGSDPLCVWQDSIPYTAFGADADGTLWLCGKKLVGLRKAEDSKRIIEASLLPIEGMRRSATSIVADKGVLLVADGTGILRRVDSKSGLRMPDVAVPDGCSAVELFQVTDRLVCVRCADSSLKIFDLTSGTFVTTRSVGADHIALHCDAFIFDNEGALWVWDMRGSLHHFDRINRVFRSVKIGNANVYGDPSRSVSVIADSHAPGVYWIGSYGGGLLRYDENAETSESITSDDAYVPENILSLAQDRSGNIWVGSEYIGIVKISPKRYVSRTVRPARKDGFNVGNNVSVVYESIDGTVWMGIRDADLCVMTPNLTREITRKEGIAPTCMGTDNRGRVWVGTTDKGIFVYDLSTTVEIAHHRHEADRTSSLADNSIAKIITDKAGRTWVFATSGAIDMAEPYGQGKMRFRHVMPAEDYRKRCVGDAMMDSEGMMWVARSKDLICFDTDRILKNQNDYVSYDYNLGEPDGIGNDDVRALCEDGLNRIWIGTGGGGLCRLTFEVGLSKFAKYERFTREDGLPSDIVTSLIVVNDSVLWLGTENGLSRFDVSSGTFTNLNVGKTKFANIFNDHACCIRSTGNIIWGSLDGMVIFNPNRRIRYSYQPTPVITNIWLDGKTVTYAKQPDIIDASSPYATQVIVGNDISELRISFSNLTHDEERGGEYSYMLDGFDSEWSRPSSTNEVSYRHLRPGRYTFKVRNVMSDDVRQLKVRVERNTNMTLIIMGASIACILAIGLPFFIVVSLRDKRIAAKARKGIDTFKRDFFLTMNRQVKSPMKMIENAVGAIHDSEGQLPTNIRSHFMSIERNTTKLSSMVNAILGMRDAQEALPLNLETTNMALFLNDLAKGYNNLATAHKIHFTLNVQGGWRVLLDRGKAEKIIGTLIDNSFKSTPDSGEISITAFANQSRQCVICITDTGAGVPKNKRSQIFNAAYSAPDNEFDLSLSTVSEYVKLHHGTIMYEPRPGGGSAFTVALPTDYSSFPEANIVLDEIDYTEPEGDEEEYDYTPQDAMGANSPISMRPTVLIVSGNEELLNFLARRMEPYYNVIKAPDSRKALSRLTSTTPDLIVCDAQTRSENGIDFIHRVKKDFTFSYVPMILLADNPAEHVDRTIECLAPESVIGKPLRLFDLLDTARELIARHDALRIDFERNNGAIATPNAADAQFFAHFADSVSVNYTRANFSIDDLAIEMQMQRNEIYTRVKEITGCTPGEYLKLWRLNEAHKIVENSGIAIAQTANSIGMTDIQYLVKCYVKLYGGEPRNESEGIDMRQF